MIYIYLHGFASSPLSRKARFFAERFAEAGIELKTPDLAPDFENLTISSQTNIVRQVMGDNREVTLIGSSMGGYVAALCAAGCPVVKQVALMAPAFGLARRWEDTLGGEKSAEWQRTGRLSVFHYGEGRDRKLSYRFIEDAARYPDYPEIRQPALILHGRMDPVVPISNSEEFARRGPDRQLVCFDSGHELTDVLSSLWTEAEAFFELGVPGTFYKKS